MTLELRLKDVDTKTGKAPQWIYVDGGQSGALKLSARKLPQVIKCSRKDHLQFFLCGKSSDLYPRQQDVIGKRDFWAESTIDQNRQIWDDGKQHTYKMDYFNQNHEKLGDLQFVVKYTRGLFYQGQLIGAERINRKLLPFYKTRCPTYNLYNCLDRHDNHPTFNFIEDIYRDEV